MSLRSRLTRAEDAAGRRGGLHEIIIHGGLPGSEPFDYACVDGGEHIERGADETVIEFRHRVHGLAAGRGETIVCFGGLP